MASDNESELSQAPSNSITPFTLAKSVVSSAPAKRTRFVANRRPSTHPKPSTPKPQHGSSTQPASNPSTTLAASSHSTTLVASGSSTALANEVTAQKKILEAIDAEIKDDESNFENNEDDSFEGKLLFLYQIQIPVSQSHFSFADVAQPHSLSTTSGVKRRMKTSGVHDHCFQVTRPEGKCFSCNYCSRFYKVSGGTGGIARHLKERHQIDPSASSVAIKRQQEGKSIDAAILRGAEINLAAQEKRKAELMGIHLDKTTLEYLYIQWTVFEDIPFNQVAHRGFRTFLEYVNPVANRLLPNAGSTIRLHAQGLFEEGKKRIRHILGTALSDIHITCDMWTSPNNLALLGVVAHFTTEKAELISITLALKELQGNHTGENEALLVQEVLQDFQFRGKLGYFVMDNAHSNDALIRSVAENLNDKGVAYDWKQRRPRCNGHVINLAVQAFLFGQQVKDYEFLEEAEDAPSNVQLTQWRKLSPLGKLHNIIIWIMGSSKRIQAFKNRSGGLMPHRDNGTRWNSWFDMLNWAKTGSGRQYLVLSLKSLIYQVMLLLRGLASVKLDS